MIVGGILVGQSIISAAEVRAQITQIEKYQTAVNTFRSKFNALPGDMRPELASQFGFYLAVDAVAGITVGHRNGDGILQSSSATFAQQGQCETAYFWTDLTSSAAGNLIDGTFPNGGSAAFGCGGSNVAVAVVATTVNQIFPTAKIGHANYMYVYSMNSINWFGLSAVLGNTTGAIMTSNANMPVNQAYAIDAKIDDGLPASGTVQAIYVNISSPLSAPNTTTSGGTSSSCYDTTTGTYSVTVNSGNGGNCALSFKFQ